MKNFVYWFFDRLFSEKIGNVICWTLLALSGVFIALQAIRGIANIIIIA